MGLSALTSSTIPDASDINASSKATKQNANQQPNAATGFSSDIWTPGQTTGFTMSAYTSKGTLVELESRQQRSFSMGINAPKHSLFKMPQQKQNELELSFTTAGGTKQTFTVTENSRFIENKDGTLSLDNGMAVKQNGDGKERDANTIIVNLDGSSVTGGTGDDMIFNLANNASLNGGDGNDVLYTMGDKSSLLGGNGDDVLKVVRNVLNKPQDSESNSKLAPTNDNLAKKGLLGYDEGMQVFMDAGEGDNTLEADVKLRNSTVTAGNGNNNVKLGIAQDSKIIMGHGQNSISMETLYGSTLKTGDGDNTINVGTVAHSSSIETGAGNDSITVSRVMDKSSVKNGDGNDSINVSHMENSVVDGGGGDDKISIGTMLGSAVTGGGGNDIITVEVAQDSIVDGGEGDDNISIKSAYQSMVLGGEGNDSITVHGSRLVVDGGIGNNTVALSGSNTMHIDNGHVVESTLTAEDTQAMLDGLTSTLDTVPMDGPSRQKYKALLQYATNQAMQAQEDGLRAE